MSSNFLYKAKDSRDGENHWWLITGDGVIILPWDGETKVQILEKVKGVSFNVSHDITNFKAFAMNPSLVAEW
ncbi:hypothetical protein QVK87_001822 [Escherichia coli]|nr:hypothetical protein [Escherichia coli]